ncbi:hypothetical protein F2P81_002152 [Scophthalmus maximus]|uniref:CD99 antigen-like protein 2 n=1 Tax=Scophthalmus maximus TaxID=52904 RepID=A0A6A4TI21_SCOMX|nr:hypothetical protein F2P81_002152 [Scophthalmus maximus]
MTSRCLRSDAFDLSDALGGDDDDSKPQLDLEDFFKVSGTTAATTTTKAPPKVVPKGPASTKAPVKPKPKPADDDLNLADALDPNNDIGGKGKNKGQGGQFSDSDLSDVSKDNTYKPDKGKGGYSGGDSDLIDQHGDNSETTAEVGTIAGIASAVVMALVGAVSSYISYQKKKLCFSMQLIGSKLVFGVLSDEEVEKVSGQFAIMCGLSQSQKLFTIFNQLARPPPRSKLTNLCFVHQNEVTNETGQSADCGPKLLLPWLHPIGQSLRRVSVIDRLTGSHQREKTEVSLSTPESMASMGIRSTGVDR